MTPYYRKRILNLTLTKTDNQKEMKRGVKVSIKRNKVKKRQTIENYEWYWELRCNFYQSVRRGIWKQFDKVTSEAFNENVFKMLKFSTSWTSVCKKLNISIVFKMFT